MEKTLYKTKNPMAFSQFFSEENFEKILEEQKSFEKCHGVLPDIEVIFFEEIPGKCAEEIKANTRYAALRSYNFSDMAAHKEHVQRQLLVTVVL
jgi:hypothetical protein